MKIDRVLHLAGRTIRDARAVKKGRIVERTGNRVKGRLLNKFTRKLWK